MSGLSETDREALASAFAGSTRSPDHLAFLAEPAVEQIVARHVTAALNEAADQIERELICCDVFDRLHDKYASEHTAAEKQERQFHAICYWAEASARIVRAATPKPPEVVSRPQPRGLGE